MKLIKINNGLFIKPEAIESIEITKELTGSVEIAINTAEQIHYTTMQNWRLRRLTQDYENITEQETELINKIVDCLAVEGFHPPHLDAFLSIITWSNWSHYTEWALFQFVKHIQSTLKLDRLLGGDND